MSVSSGYSAIGELTDDTVLAEGDAVVGEEYEEGVIEEVQLLHLVQEAPQPAVHHRKLPGVAGLHPLQLPGSR